MIGGIGAAALALPGAARATSGPIERALAAAGGRELLARVAVIAWSGTAQVMLGTTRVALNVETRIEPFTRGQSNTWLTSEGRSAMRTLMVEGDSGFVVHDGAQTPLPAAMAMFERQQLGAYAYFLLARATLLPAGARRLNAAHAGYPPIVLDLATDGRVAAADYLIASPHEGAPGIRQHFSLSGSITAHGVHFPRTITILQDGRGFMKLQLTELSIELDPA